MVEAVGVPVSADLENCFADDPAGVAETVRLAVEAGLAGCSVEDFTRRPDDAIYDLGLARDRVAAAAEAAHAGPTHLVLTARAENHLHGRADLADTIARLQAFQEAGADVLYAPGLTKVDEIRTVVESVDRAVNVLMLAGGPTVGELADCGVRRISVGGAFSWVATGAVVEAAQELLEQGTYGFGERVRIGRAAGRAAFGG
jgi:2-methylisocitrate lyase-like PEP mutase family enzyme